MWINFLVVAAGSSIGAVGRYILSLLVKANWRFAFPLGTFLINMIGATLLGYLTAIAVPAHWRLFIGTGIIAGFTTFSTFQVDLVELFRNRKIGNMVSYALLTYGGGLAAVLFGLWLGK